MRVAVVVLNWNGEKLLREFLPSVLRYTNPEVGEVVVADNASTDRSLAVLREEFPQVNLLCLDKNYGFAGGYNRAIAELDAEYVVLLNSDVEVSEYWLEPMVALLDREKAVAAVQPKIKAYREKQKFEYAGACGGYIDRFGFPFCRGRILDTTEEDRGQYDDVAEVFWASGAALCVRRTEYIRQGGLDERFFAHMEEIDLCWRLRNAGHRLKVVPESVVYHLGGGSLPMNHPQKLYLNYRNNLLMLYKNLDRVTYKKTMRVRRGLDFMAWGVFLLKFQFRNAGAVCRAYRSFRGMKKNYQPVTHVVDDACIYPKSIVFDYFFRRIKSFFALNWRNRIL